MDENARQFAGKSVQVSDIQQFILRDHGEGQWLRFTEPQQIFSITNIDQVRTALAAVQRAAEAHDWYAVGFICYEAAPAFDPAYAVASTCPLPLIYFALFAEAQPYELPSAPATSPEHSWLFDTSQSAYDQVMETIHSKIGAGDVYQINHTVRAHARLTDPWQTFLSKARSAAYGAYLQTRQFTVISASPELLFSLAGEHVVSRPMKGTAPRGESSDMDEQRAATLRTSAKNCAENLMITDMVRNDLGRIARPGSVKVPGLFSLEPHATVWQMTSEVTADTTAEWVDVVDALFPPASITGAPKAAAMQVIDELESSPRGIYTGTIGYLAPGRKAQFNVAIRTIHIENDSSLASYGVGGGIVWDSRASDEYAELLAKTKVLYRTPASPDFELFETLAWSAESGFSRLNTHLQRLQRSAAFFKMPYSRERIEAALQNAVASIKDPSKETLRVRLALPRSGEAEVVLSALSIPPAARQEISLAHTPVSADEVLLKHKTNCRWFYDRAQTEVGATAEPILFNTDGEITETNIANVVYKIGERYYTPPARCGLLPGTLREELLQQGQVTERLLRVSEVGAVDGLYLINDLRGWRETYWQVDRNYRLKA